MPRWIQLLVCAAVLCTSFAWSQTQAEHQIGGRTASESFDPAGADLARAACVGDLVAIRLALDAGTDANMRGADGLTPPVWAQHCSSLDGVRALLQAGADPNLRLTTRANHSAVTLAAMKREPEFLALLLEYGGDPNASIADSTSTALQIALDRALDEWGWDNYYALLAAGADINLMHAGGTIAESLASINRYDKVIELLERGYNARYGFVARQAERVVPERLHDQAQYGFAQRVIEILKERGVAFPIPGGPLEDPPEWHAGPAG